MSTGKNHRAGTSRQRVESQCLNVTKVPEAGAGLVPTERQSLLHLSASWALCLGPLSLLTEPDSTLCLMRLLESLRLLPCTVVALELLWA